jgi:hypothetical protein
VQGKPDPFNVKNLKRVSSTKRGREDTLPGLFASGRYIKYGQLGTILIFLLKTGIFSSILTVFDKAFADFRLLCILKIKALNKPPSRNKRAQPTRGDEKYENKMDACVADDLGPNGNRCGRPTRPAQRRAFPAFPGGASAAESAARRPLKKCFDITQTQGARPAFCQE